MRLVNEYLIPLRISIQNECDKLVLSKNSISRSYFQGFNFIMRGSSVVMIGLNAKWRLRTRRVYSIINKMTLKSMDNELIVNYINDQVKRRFHLETDKFPYEDWETVPKPGPDYRIMINSAKSGSFWNNFSPYLDDKVTKPAIELFENNILTNYDEYIRLYNNIVSELYNIESKIVIKSLDKAKKELINGMQINDTKKDTKQVPLFFE